MPVTLDMSGNKQPNTLAAQMAALARTAEGTSLYLLRAVDQTVDSLCWLAKALSGIGELAVLKRNEIREGKVLEGHYLDPEDKIISQLERATSHFENELPKLLISKGEIDKDHDLTADQKEMLHSAYGEALEEMAALVESVKDLRAAVISHDLAAEPRNVQAHESMADLVKTLHSA